MGAGSRLQWGRGLSAAEGDVWQGPKKKSRQGFNGAAAFRPRKAVLAKHYTTAGYGFNGAAAFRPRKERLRKPDKRAPLGFNGAAAFRPRKGRLALMGVRLGAVASMGPRPFGRGRGRADNFAVVDM